MHFEIMSVQEQRCAGLKCNPFVFTLLVMDPTLPDHVISGNPSIAALPFIIITTQGR
jgi:hypothetical protein